MERIGNETADLYDDVWRRGTYSGFSHDTCGQSSTPFLDEFLEAVKELRAHAPRIVELGAGSCDHALRFARSGVPTTAVEYSGAAVAAARARAQEYPGIPLEIVQADLFAFTATLAASRLTGAYANAVFHFLSAEQRRGQYRVLRQALVERGLLAISFKAEGDALQSRGSVAHQTTAGPVVRGDDGICRLFVAEVDVLAQEMRDEGFTVCRAIRWSVPDYNIPAEKGEFVGLLASRCR